VDYKKKRQVQIFTLFKLCFPKKYNKIILHWHRHDRCRWCCLHVSFGVWCLV